MSREKLITAVDIGSSRIRVGCALLERGAAPRLIGIGESESLGVRRGQVVDLQEVVTSLEKAFREAERTAGVKISQVQTAIGGPQVELKHSSGSVAVSRADGTVSGEDVRRVLDAARAVSLPQNKQIIATIPLSYSVDDDTHIENPEGMLGVRLEAQVLLILASQPVIRTVGRALSETQKRVEQWVYAPLAASRAVLSKKQKEAGVVLVDIGGGMTTASVFKERELKDTIVVPVGGSHITNDIAVQLRVALDVAERIKTTYGAAYTKEVSKREQVVLADWGLDDVSIGRHALAKIIESRLREIFSAIETELSKNMADAQLPAGVVLTGGGAHLSDIVTLAKQELKLPVHKARIREIESDLPEAFDPDYAVIAGTVLLAYDEEEHEDSSLIPHIDAESMGERLKDWLGELLP